MSNFETMDLFEPLKRALAEQKYVTPTPIQTQTIPPAVAGQDILGCAQTGTGKTAAFALPILDYLGHEKPVVKPGRPKALILAPTRELAIQISDSFRVYGKYVQFKQALVYGGVNQNKQVQSLRQGVHVLIATPGRLLDLMQQGFVNLQDVDIFVLDEADRMLGMGFLPDLKRIIARLPNERQSMFFSATLPKEIRDFSETLLFNPVSVNVTPKSPCIKLIRQEVQMVEHGDKLGALCGLLGRDEVERTIVFTRTKHGANRLAKSLARNGIQSTAIHGNKSQNARQKALDSFRRNEINVLVATDVAARGIDIDGVTHVVNYDMPVEAESYVHRIGRTGRAGAEGVAISYCSSAERKELWAIEKLIGQTLQVQRSSGRSKSQGSEIVRTNESQSFGRSQSTRDSNSRSVNGRSANSRNGQTGSRVAKPGFGSKSRFVRGKKKQQLSRTSSSSR